MYRFRPNERGDYLKGRVRVGEVFNDELGTTEPVKVAKLQISEDCPNLIRTIEIAPRDEDDRETIAEFLGDDALQSSGYGLYAMFGKPAAIPVEERVANKLAEITYVGDPLFGVKHSIVMAEENKKKPVPVQFGRRNHRRRKPVY